MKKLLLMPLAAGLLLTLPAAADSSGTSGPAAQTGAVTAAPSGTPGPAANNDPNQVIRGYLSADPWQIAPDITDRAFWESKRRLPFAARTIAGADRLLKEELVAPGDDLYLEFTRNGTRVNYEKVFNQLASAVRNLTLAACLTGEQKYISRLEQAIDLQLRLKSWVLPAHDGKLINFRGEGVTIDLGSSTTACRLAAVNRVAGPRLDPELRRRIAERLEHFIINPYDRMRTGRQTPDWWINTTNNWNAVCVANVTMVVLMSELEPERRYFILRDLFAKSRNFLRGFNPEDGYCSEGVGYWNYGFGHYLDFCLAVRLASNGRIDFYERPQNRQPAEYPERIQLAPELVPAFSDCAVTARFSKSSLGIRDYLAGVDSAWAAGLGFTTYNELARQLMLLNLPAPDQPPPEATMKLTPLSDFPSAGVFVCRPGTRFRDCRLAVAFKGGSNHEFHNHNDVGSFVAAVDGIPVLVDPGVSQYTRDTFSSKRYQNQFIGSYGHSVPLIDGRGQVDGQNTDARLEHRKVFRDQVVVTFDIAPAYSGVPGVKSLLRTFDYSRLDAGRLIVTDAGKFEKPVNFESALVTFGEVTSPAPGQLEIAYRGVRLGVTVDAGGRAFEITPQRIENHTLRQREPVTRIAVKLSEPTAEPFLRFTMVPLQ